MLPGRSWRIYYGDGATFSSQDGPPEVSPALNVQAVVQPDPTAGRIVLTRFDFYWHEPDGWYGGDLFGLFDYLTRPGLKVVRFGRTIPTADHARIVSAAAHDPDFLHLARPA